MIEKMRKIVNKESSGLMGWAFLLTSFFKLVEWAKKERRIYGYKKNEQVGKGFSG